MDGGPSKTGYAVIYRETGNLSVNDVRLPIYWKKFRALDVARLGGGDVLRVVRVTVHMDEKQLKRITKPKKKK